MCRSLVRFQDLKTALREAVTSIAFTIKNLCRHYAKWVFNHDQQTLNFVKVRCQLYHLLPWVAEGVSRVGDLVVPVLGGGGQVGHQPLLGLLHRAGGPVHVLPHLQQLTMQRNREIFIMFIEGWTKYFSKGCENFRDISLLPYSHRCRHSCSAPRRGRSCTGPPSAGRWSPALCSTPATICLY